MRTWRAPFYASHAPVTGLRIGFLLVLVLASLLLDSRVVRAEEGPPLVVLVDPGVPTLARRLREEIEALGLAVRSVPAEDPDVSLELRARSSNAVAAVRIASRSGAVEMTIVDRATGKTVSRRLAIDTPSDPAAAELIATRTVELLRASLMELAAEHPARGEVTVHPVIEEISSEEARPSGGVSLAAGPNFRAGSGVDGSFGFWTALRVLFGERFGVTLQLVLPLTPGELETPEGTVKAFATEYRAGATFEDTLFASALSLRGEAGVLIAQLGVEGSASPPYVGSRDDLVALGPWLGARLRLELTRNFGLMLGGDAAYVFPRLVIRSAGREVATWGRPMGSLAIAAEFTWQ